MEHLIAELSISLEENEIERITKELRNDLFPLIKEYIDVIEGNEDEEEIFGFYKFYYHKFKSIYYENLKKKLKKTRKMSDLKESNEEKRMKNKANEEREIYEKYAQYKDTENIANLIEKSKKNGFNNPFKDSSYVDWRDKYTGILNETKNAKQWEKYNAIEVQGRVFVCKLES